MICPKKLPGSTWIIIPFCNNDVPDQLQAFLQAYYLLSKQIDNVKVVEAYQTKPRLQKYVGSSNLIQIKSNKEYIAETLINIGSRKLPTNCDKLVWLTPGIVFLDNDWLHRLSLYLEHYKLVQPFTYRVSGSTVDALGNGTVQNIMLNKNIIGWAYRRTVIDGLGLYENKRKNLLDNMLYMAATGQKIDVQIRDRAHFNPWASEIKDRVLDSVARMPGRVFHITA